MRSREVLMCSVRYADDIRFLLPNTQLPPTRSLFSKQSNGIPASFSFLAAAMPDEPAPMMHAVGSSRGVVGAAKQDGTGVSTLARPLVPAGRSHSGCRSARPLCIFTCHGT